MTALACNVLDKDSIKATVHTIHQQVISYSAVKAGIDNFTQWLAIHMVKENIRCNALAPGFFLTSQNRNMLFDAHGELN